MNLLVVGSDKSAILETLPETFLFIDDGDLLDKIPRPKRRKITELDLSIHAFNPLKDIDYKRARDFVSVLNSVFPEGQETLTKKSSNFALLSALLNSPKYLHQLIPPHSKDVGVIDAYQKIQTLLLSPVLNKFLCKPTNFSLDGILLARLDRTVLSDFDCFVVANLLISNFQGHVVVPDFGFYASPFHVSLIRQNRLVAGVNFLDEAKDLRDNLLLIERKLASKCTAEDADILASYAGLPKGRNDYMDFIQRSIS